MTDKNSRRREIVLTFKNTNHSVRAETALAEAGIAVRVMPLPAAISAGCGLCLRVDPEDAQRAIGLLERVQAPVLGAYTREACGGKSGYEEFTGEA